MPEILSGCFELTFSCHQPCITWKEKKLFFFTAKEIYNNLTVISCKSKSPIVPSLGLNIPALSIVFYFDSQGEQIWYDAINDVQ